LLKSTCTNVEPAPFKVFASPGYGPVILIELFGVAAAPAVAALPGRVAVPAVVGAVAVVPVVRVAGALLAPVPLVGAALVDGAALGAGAALVDGAVLAPVEGAPEAGALLDAAPVVAVEVPPPQAVRMSAKAKNSVGNARSRPAPPRHRTGRCVSSRIVGLIRVLTPPDSNQPSHTALGLRGTIYRRTRRATLRHYQG